MPESEPTFSSACGGRLGGTEGASCEAVQARSRGRHQPRQRLSSKRRSNELSFCGKLLLYFANISFYSVIAADHVLSLSTHVLALAEHRLAPSKVEHEQRQARYRGWQLDFKKSKPTGRTGDLAFNGGLAFVHRKGSRVGLFTRL